jgi:hypothetical protein
MRTAGGELRLERPEIYQIIDGQRRQVAGSYVLQGGQQVGFEIGAFDPGQPLVIDPVLSYSTYLGAATARIWAPALPWMATAMPISPGTRSPQIFPPPRVLTRPQTTAALVLVTRL